MLMKINKHTEAQIAANPVDKLGARIDTSDATIAVNTKAISTHETLIKALQV
jgi:hypothetical protein